MDSRLLSNSRLCSHPVRMVSRMIGSIPDRMESKAEGLKALNSKRLLVSSIRKIHMPGKPAMGCEAVGSQTTTAALPDSPRGAVGARANVPLRKQRRLLRRKIAVRSGTDVGCGWNRCQPLARVTAFLATICGKWFETRRRIRCIFSILETY